MIAFFFKGVLEDDLLVTALLHKYGSLSFWDYASAAPYTNIDVNPKVNSKLSSFSPNKTF